MQKEEKRAFHQMFEGGGEAARQEYRELWTDASILRNSARKTEYSFTSDYFGDILPEDIKTAAFKSPNINDHLMEKRVNEEAYLRSANPVIAEIGGETPEENYMRAHDDITDIRYELQIPEKGVPDPLDVYRATAYPTAPVTTPEGSEDEPSTVPENSEISDTGVTRVSPPWVDTEDGREKPRDSFGALIPPESKNRVYEPEDEVIRVFVPPLRQTGSEKPRLFPEDQDAGTGIAEVRKVADSSSEADGEPKRRRARLGILEEPDMDSEDEKSGSPGGVIIEGRARRITDEDVAREKRDDPLRDIVDKLKDTDWGGELKGRVRSLVGGLPRPGLRRALLVAGNLVGAAGVIVGGKMLIDQMRANPAQEYDYGVAGAPRGVDVRNLPSGGVPGVVDPRSIPFEIGRSGEVIVKPTATPQETVRVQTPYKTIEVELPPTTLYRGKREIKLRELTGNEPEIFNVPSAPSGSESTESSQVTISGEEIKRAIENPEPDDEAAKIVRSYLSEANMHFLTAFSRQYVPFPTIGPEGERLKKEFASLKGEYEAQWGKAALGSNFDMRSVIDLEKLQQLQRENPSTLNWNLWVASALLQSGHNPSIVGFMIDRDSKKINDVIIQTGTSDKLEMPYLNKYFPRIEHGDVK